MSVNYKVIFEHYNNEFTINGVTDNKSDMSKIAGSISSKGFDHTAVIIDYTCNTPLNNEFYIVYKTPTKTSNNVIVEGMFPSEDDIFLYKTEKSAIDRYNKFNTDGHGFMRKITMNTMYTKLDAVDIANSIQVEEYSLDYGEEEETPDE